VSSVPCIAFEDLDAALHDRLSARVQRLGYLGEFFQIAAHQPVALAGFIDFTEALKDALPSRLVETIALTCAALTGNSYERVQHEHLALRLGFTVEEIRGLIYDSPGATPTAADERAAARMAAAVVHARGRSCKDEFEALAALVGGAIAIGCLMTATRYLAHATMANTWELDPPVASPLTSAGDHG
jgi:alkylhydroperoxidase family enzyme